MRPIIVKRKGFDIPAKVYMSLAGQFAIAHGRKFFTMRQQMQALAFYENFAPLKN